MLLNSTVRVSGWVLPDGQWLECAPWEHISFAKSINFVLNHKEKNIIINEIWSHPDEELLRSEFAKLGMIKVSYNCIDADYINEIQMKKLQEIYSFSNAHLDEDIEFIGKINFKIQLRMFLKIRNPERLNNLTG